MNLKLPKDKFPYIFCFVYFVFNSFHISKVLSLSHDSIYYYDEIINRPDNLFPHHLLFTPFTSFVANIILSFGIKSDIAAITMVNVLAGAIVIFIIYKTLIENFRFSKIHARIAILLCSFSFAFWFYNLNIETYQLPLVFVFTSIYFLTKDPKRNKYIFISAFLGGIGVLFHQLHGLFGLVAVLFLIIVGFKKNIKSIIIFTIVFNIVWIFGYSVVIYLLGFKSINEIIHWFFLYHHTMDAWSEFGSSFFLQPFVGIIRSLISVNAIFISGVFSDKISRIFADRHLLDDAYIVRNLDEKDLIIYLILLIVLTCLILYVLISNYKKLKSQPLNNNNVILIYVFLIIYSGFFIFWVPNNMEFWIPQSLFLWIGFSIFINSIESKKNKIVISSFIILFLFTINFRYTIVLTNDINNDYYYVQVSDAVKKLPENLVIIYDTDWIVSKYYEIYAPYFIFLRYHEISNFYEAGQLIDFIYSLKEQNKTIVVKSELLTDYEEKNKMEVIKLGTSSFYLFSSD